MTPILTAATVLAATGLASTFFLYRFQFPRERRKAGRALFAAMDWGDFIHLVLALLNARGYERGFGGGGTDGEYLLQHRGQDWLLSSRHSRAYAPGTTAIAEFSNHIRKRGLDGGILAIPQRFPRAAHALGRAHRVDLLDSDSMWEEMQPLLSEDQHAAIDRPAHARMYLQLVVAWTLAIALAVATYMSIKPRPEVGAITPATANASMGAAEAATPPPPPP
ncbi:restriction endonuclease, partial [Luteimonas sp. 8-5]|uniref:restriction endonuclease n=1 Tax=Luteimonas sp. 8-5 TaxID=3039387 RepID=UPI00243689A3